MLDRDRSQDHPSTIAWTKPVDRNTKYICRFCKVEVYSKTDKHAVMGHEHKKSCPRRSKF